MPRRAYRFLAACALTLTACGLAPGGPAIPLPTVFVPPTAAPATLDPAKGPTEAVVAPATPAPAVRLAEGQAKLWDVAVDGTDVYWTNCGTDPYTQDGTVMKAPKGGGAAVALASGQACPTEVALDAGNVYWLAGAFETGYFVMRVAKGGGEAAVVAQGHDVRSLAVDDSGVYWSDCQTSTDDCAVLRLGPGAAEPVALAAALAYPDALALDADSVYWVNGSTTVMRVTKEAGGTVQVLASSQFYPQALAVDDANVYWTGLNYVMQVEKASGNRVVLAIDQSPADLALDASHVYWANYDGGVLRVPKGGGQAELIAADGAGGKNVVVDGDRVYWSNFDLGTLTEAAKAGQPAPPPAATGAVTLAGAQEALTGLAADAAGVYWSTCGTEATNYLDGLVVWLGVEAPVPLVLAAEQSCPVVIGADADRVYWYAGRYYDPSSGDLYAVPKMGGEPQVLFAGLTNVSDFAVDGPNVYWSSCGTQAQNFADSAILAAPLAGGDPVTLVADCGILAVDAQNLYWSNANGIFGLPRSGGEPRLLGPGGADLVADGSALYFTTFESTSDTTFLSCADEHSTAFSLPISGGEPATLAIIEGASLGLAAGATDLFWAGDCVQGIMRLPKTGGEPAQAVEVVGRVGNLAVNDNGLYWTNVEYGTVNKLVE